MERKKMKKEFARSTVAMTVNVLIKKEDDVYIAHCLELDIVTTGNTSAQVEKDIVALINAQVSYAFSNNNLENLYHPAPPEVWKEFFACKEQKEKRHRIKPPNNKDKALKSFIPPWIITNTCLSPKIYHA